MLVGRHPDDGERHPVEPDLRAHRARPGPEELFAHVLADDAHAPRFLLVAFAQEAALGNRNSAQLGVDRLHAERGERAGIVGAHGANLIIELGDRLPHQVAFGPNGGEIEGGQAHAAAGALSSGLLFRTAAEHDDDVIAQRLRVLVLALLETVPHRDDEDDRRHSPGDPGHQVDVLPNDVVGLCAVKAFQVRNGMCGEPRHRNLDLVSAA